MWEHIYQAIDELYEKMVETRRHLHQYPEASFNEEKTAQFIVNTYKKLGIPYESHVGGNGVIAKLEGGKPGKTVALRADFDALPIQEENDVPYRSKNEGVMHACGHDGHTAALLGLAEAIIPHKEELPGTIIFLHQHAEEYAPGGAKPIVESGALTNVDAVFGTHLWVNAPTGVIQTAKGPFMAGADRFEIKIQGKGGHGAQPHQTKDAIVIASQLVSSLQQIVSRRVDPLRTAVLSVGTFESGTTFNIIADSAKLTGTVRTFDPEVQNLIIEEMEKVIKGACTGYDAEYEFLYEKGYPPVVNHPEEAELVLQNANKADASLTTEEIEPVMAGEDFAYYLLDKPGAFYFTGAQIPDHYYPHHHPKFDFDETALPHAAKTLFQSYISYQEKQGI
ncbi:M20 metallopeptidase family protein [Halobacillus karajensis]|uniref:N-acyl-L-amino acid amidohydrolase n=1 Tax=Halobacillus karajensis TaxID=195088 RepID=A0A059NWC8_9BACI|nr:M20 family metallopeptidase [Halobacillus karajensis]CDQ21101.1 N-acyl-L-amino acid amidohydrolase [Halobacillus karajensis]CDQ24835.1 N-acyl-L-amino acid amidohydrolase [Halobacillus karajensis]CDQ28805.1 N-acyl-L-amino acid amidohydrolase [Halobacillus karajensis]